jgi:predicted acylesterase/phospholipase RssA
MESLSPAITSAPQSPKQELKDCDLVMKGGITSGIVYPPVLLKLKEKFRFRNIGGTSAGAIAAAGAAAAEYGRQCGAEIKYPNKSGFRGLQNINEQLGSCLLPRSNESSGENPTNQKGTGSCEVTFLQNLFQPTIETNAIFKLALELFTEFQKKDRPSKTLLGNFGLFIRLLKKVKLFHFSNTNQSRSINSENQTYQPFKKGGFLGIFIAILLSILVSSTIFLIATLLGDHSSFILLIVIVLVLGIPLSLTAYFLGGLGLTIVGLFRNFTEQVIKGNNFGFCNGMDGVSSVPGEPALTQWLHTDVINTLADPDLKNPLTFGDLKSKEIILRMVTSNVSKNIPYVLPFENPIFIFKENDFRILFPGDVVDFMKSKPSRTDKNLPSGYHFFPKPEDFPVVVATRMSLSFPILFSAIPLYTIKVTQQDSQSIGVDNLQLNWFSDGGISSNFPIHFFDGWIPSRPTFGINLGTWQEKSAKDFAEKDKSKSSKNSTLSSLTKSVPLDLLTCTKLTQSTTDNPDENSDRRVVLPIANDVPVILHKELGHNLLAFLGAIFSTSQNYRDTMQSMLSGYRERIVEIKLNDAEGGLNLNMPEEVIAVLKELGDIAGDKLCNEFSFEHHQWVRLKTMMGLLESQLHQVASAVQNSKFDYVKLLNEQAKNKTFPYPETDLAWKQSALQRLSELDTLIRAWEVGNAANDEPQKVFATLEPLKEDKPVLRVTPQI